MFSVLNGYLFKPLPYPHAQRLIQVDQSFMDEGLLRAGMSVPMYNKIRQRVRAFSASALFAYSGFDVEANGHAEMVGGALVTPSVFNVLGVRPFIGHTFSAGATQPGRGHEVVLSYPFWQQEFGGDRKIIGRNVRIGGNSYRIIGVMPKSFAFTNRSMKLWAPMPVTAAERATAHTFDTHAYMIARLRPGVSAAATGDALHKLLGSVARKGNPQTRKAVASGAIRITLTPWRQTIVGDKAQTVLLLEAAVLFLLLITCVNVASLLLSRILGRTHEIALRAALGASRWRLARQLLIEGLCLAVPGGIVGVALGWLSLRFFAGTALGPGDDIISLQPDWRVGGFAVAIVALTGIVISLLPLWHLTRTDLQGLLQEGGRMAGGRRARRVRSMLVVTELALATVLLAGCGLLLHSLIRLQNVNPGYRLNGVLLAQTVMPSSGGGSQASIAFYRQVQQRVKALPGVSAVGMTNVVPFADSHHVSDFNVRGAKTTPPEANIQVINGAFFHSLGIPILRGRGLDARDRKNGRPVVVINRMLARKAFPNANPIGRQIQVGGRYGEQWFTIVGVIPTLKIYSLAQTVERGTIYFPYSQIPKQGVPNLGLVIKASVPPASLAKSVRRTVHEINPAVALYNVEPLHARMLETLGKRQATLNLILIFGGIALALAFVGVYGVLSYAVRQRRAECGVRLALGAEPRDLLWLFIKDGLRLLAAGLVSGLVLAVVVGFVASSQLFGVAPFDPATLAGVVVVLSGATLLACYLPARRAAKLDPAIAMMEQ